MSKWIFIEFLDPLQSKINDSKFMCVRSKEKKLFTFFYSMHISVCVAAEFLAEILNFNFYLMDSLILGSFLFGSFHLQPNGQAKHEKHGHLIRLMVASFFLCLLFVCKLNCKTANLY